MARVQIVGDLPPRDGIVIYGLLEDEVVRYVGRTARFRPRMNEHVTHAAIPGHQGNDDLGRWILSQDPLRVRVLEVVSDGDGVLNESRWIAALPNLLNISPGQNRARDGSNGRRGRAQSEATRARQSAAMKRIRAERSDRWRLA